MITPELQQVIQHAKHYNLIPVARRLIADTETPIRLFQQLAQERHAFLLESVEGGVKWARYSFIGTDPFLVVRGKNGQMQVEHRGQIEVRREKPIEMLKAYLRSYSSPAIDDLPPFTGGAIGFFGYDLLQYYESLPAHRMNDLNMDDLNFMFCDQVVVFDHVKQQILIVANVHVEPGDTDEEIASSYAETCRKIEAMIDRLNRPVSQPHMIQRAMPSDVDLSGVRSNMTPSQFISNVKQAQEYIRAGDIFQVVLSQRFEMETSASPLQVYRILRTLNPSPYMYYLKLDEEVIVGASPEALVKVDGNRVETRPIAGTRHRGRTPEQDIALGQELLADEKERAEHLMLVDLGRNDIGRVSEYGSVQCDSYMEIERYSHVMHIVSNVSGKLRKDKDFFDAFVSCMPAGTVSGAPKLRAMEIIAELENEARGAYAGAIGYLGFSGSLNTCITIRTIIFKHGKAYVQAGAGIVWDSVPENEYQETVNKAKALLTSVKLAEAVFADHTGADQAPVQETNQDYFIQAQS